MTHPSEQGQAPGRDRAADSLAAGLGCALLVVLLYASFTLVSRFGLKSSLGVADLAAIRFSTGGLLLSPVLLRQGLRGLALQQALALAILGGLGFALLCYVGFSLAPASHGGVLVHGCLPLFTFAILWSTGTARRDRGTIAGVMLIAAGVVAMMADTLSASTVRQLGGDMCLLAASLCWSGYGALAARWRVSPLHAASLVAGLSLCLFLPFYLVLPSKQLLHAPATDILLQIVFQGVLIGAGSILVYTRALVSLGPGGIALFAAAVPGLTGLAAVPLLGEIPGQLAIAGMTLTTVGMLVGLTGAAATAPFGLARRVTFLRRRETLSTLPKTVQRDLGLDRLEADRVSGTHWRPTHHDEPRHL